MKSTTSLWVGRSLIVITAAVASACAENTPAAPRTATIAARSNGNRLPDLTGCEFLAAPDTSTLVFQAFGVGVQIYHWNGTTWGAPTPAATLYAVDPLGVEKMIRNLTWVGASDYNSKDSQRKIWKFNEDIAGYSKKVRNLNYVMVRGAGNYAILDQPQVTLEMITKFCRGEDF